jgi:hypothetical protein
MKMESKKIPMSDWTMKMYMLSRLENELNKFRETLSGAVCISPQAKGMIRAYEKCISQVKQWDAEALIDLADCPPGMRKKLEDQRK